MPTKARREREAKRATEAVKRKELLEKIPNHILQRMTPDRVSKIPPCNNIDSKLNMQGGFLTWDDEGNPWWSPNIGKGGNEARRNNRKDAALALKRKYADIWGKRGTAKVIQIDTNKPSQETKLSLRAVQKYFKDFP